MRRYARGPARPARRRRSIAATLIARFPIGINALALVLYLRARDGLVRGRRRGGGRARGRRRASARRSQGRLVDRLGQRRVLRPARVRPRRRARRRSSRSPSSARRPSCSSPVGFVAGFAIPPTSSVLRSMWPTCCATARAAPGRLRARLGADRADLHHRPAADRGARRASSSPAGALIVSAVAVITGTDRFTALAPTPRVRARRARRRAGRSARSPRPACARWCSSRCRRASGSGCSRSGIPAFSRAEGAAAAAGVLLAMWSLGSAARRAALRRAAAPRRRSGALHLAGQRAAAARRCCRWPPRRRSPVMALLVIPAGLLHRAAARDPQRAGRRRRAAGRAHRGLHVADDRVRRRDRDRRGAVRRARRGRRAGGPRSSSRPASRRSARCSRSRARRTRPARSPSSFVPCEVWPIRSLSSLRRFASGSTRAFAEPTAAQAQAWPAIATGEHVLISAPTGSGKTLAAFLWALDRFVARADARGQRRGWSTSRR